MIKIVVLFLLIFLLVQLVYAEQPALPTSLYGIVYRVVGEPAEGVDVSIIWVDSDGIEHTTTTKSLTLTEAEDYGDQNLVGNYLFNKGFIKAKLNSEIKVIINGFVFEKVNSNPGGIVKVRDAILISSSNVGSGYGSGSPGGLTSSSGQGSGSESGPGVSSTGTRDSGAGTTGTGTESSGSADESDSSGTGTEGSSGTDGDSSSSSSSTGSGASGTGSESASGSSSTGASTSTSDTAPISSSLAPVPIQDSSTQYTESIATPSLPTNLYGKVVNEKGDPISGEVVTAEWTDEFGINRTSTAKTLSKKEAKSLNDETLEGYYFFNEGDIHAAPNSTIKVKSQLRFNSRKIKSEPGKIKEVKPITLFGVEQERDNDINSFTNKIINKTGSISLENFKRPAKFVGNILLLLTLIAAIVIYILRRKRRIGNRSIIEFKLYKEITSFEDVKVKKIMTKKVRTISKEAALSDAVDMLITKGLNSLVVVNDNIPIGMISESDFLKKVYIKRRKENLKVMDIMSSPLITINPNSTIFECIGLIIKTKCRKIPIVKNGKLEGIVTATDILRFFNEFYSRHIFDTNNMPLIRSIMSKEVYALKDTTKLSEVLSYMLWKKTSYFIVTSNNNNQNKNSIITIKDSLNEFYKIQDKMYSLKIKQTTRTPLINTTPGTSIIEALKITLDRNYRRIPVIANNKIVGIVTQLILLEALYNFTKETLKSLEKHKN